MLTYDKEDGNLYWYCRGDVIDGPRICYVDDADCWDYFCNVDDYQPQLPPKSEDE